MKGIALLAVALMFLATKWSARAPIKLKSRMTKSDAALSVVLMVLAVSNFTAFARADTPMTPVSQSAKWGAQKAYRDGETMIKTSSLIEKFRARVINQVQSNWRPPCVDGRDQEVVLNFRFSRDGRAVDVRVARSSGYVALDKSAIDALEHSADFDGCVAPFAFLFSIYGESTFEVVFDAAGNSKSSIQLKQIDAQPVVKEGDISLDLDADEVARDPEGQGRINGRVLLTKSKNARVRPARHGN